MFAHLPGPPREFEIARVLEDAVSVTVRQSWPFVILACLIGAPPEIYAMLHVGATPEPAVNAVRDPAAAALYVLSTLAVFGMQGMVVHHALEVIERGRGDRRASVAVALRRAPRVLAASVALSAAVTFGSFLLIAPGLYACEVWFVAVPAVVVEGKGVRAAFARSGALTRGVR